MTLTKSQKLIARKHKQWGPCSLGSYWKIGEAKQGQNKCINDCFKFIAANILII